MNPDTLHYINMLLGLGAILLQILSVAALGFLLLGPKENIFLDFIKKYFLPIGFLITFSAVLVSLFYSEILHYLPCFHCWVSRIFIFSQAFIFGVAWLRKDRNVLFYSLPLTLCGLADSLYLNYLYYFSESTAPCDASGVSCVQRLVSELGGYISIPMMALSGFFALLTLLAVAHFYKKD
jgi:disulfide bond formation protein DsbB